MTIEKLPQKLVGWIVRGLETAKECRQFHVFGIFYRFFLGLPKAIVKTFFHESESIS